MRWLVDQWNRGWRGENGKGEGKGEGEGEVVGEESEWREVSVLFFIGEHCLVAGVF